jgi:hypothetical protein
VTAKRADKFATDTPRSALLMCDLHGNVAELAAIGNAAVIS